MPCVVDSEAVVDFLTAVQREDDVMHFAISKFCDLIVKQNAVGRESEADILVMELLLFAAVFDELLADIPVHQGFAAEEVDVEILVET